MANKRKSTKVNINLFIEIDERDKWHALAKAFGSPSLSQFIRDVMLEKEVQASRLHWKATKPEKNKIAEPETPYQGNAPPNLDNSTT